MANSCYCFSLKERIDAPIKLNGYFSVPRELDGANYTRNIFFSDRGFIVNALLLDDIDWDVNNSGVFKVSGDTITTLEFTPTPTLNHNGIFTNKYLIIDSNTIKEIFSYVIDSKREVSRPMGGIGKFTSMQKLPNIRRFWLTKQSWFWCNMEEYEEFWREDN